MNTSDRLRTYYPFDETVIETISQVAADQNQYSFRELADRYGLADGPSKVRIPGMRGPLEYIALEPKDDYDPYQARICMAPMATAVDTSMTMRAMRLFAADPSKLLLVAGSPTTIGNPSNRLSPRGVGKVWNGDLRPVVNPILSHASKKAITGIDLIGYSFGADSAAMAAGVAHEHGIDIGQSVLMEPASTEKRGVLKLLQAFKSSESSLARYVSATESEPLFEARELADVGLSRYVGGLLRASNIAIAHVLAEASFYDRLEAALKAQPAMRTTVAWGDESELAANEPLRNETDKLIARYGEQRLRQLVIPGMRHAGGDDIDLHAAIVLQALSAPRTD